jgi:hypothetical protein
MDKSLVREIADWIMSTNRTIAILQSEQPNPLDLHCRGMCASLTLNEWVSDLQLILRVSQASDVEVQGLTVTY